MVFLFSLKTKRSTNQQPTIPKEPIKKEIRNERPIGKQKYAMQPFTFTAEYFPKTSAVAEPRGFPVTLSIRPFGYSDVPVIPVRSIPEMPRSGAPR